MWNIIFICEMVCEIFVRARHVFLLRVKSGGVGQSKVMQDHAVKEFNEK